MSSTKPSPYQAMNEGNTGRSTSLKSSVQSQMSPQRPCQFKCK